MKHCQTRVVALPYQGRGCMFEVLRYECDMEKCIVKGPFLCDDERDEDKEETHTFDSDLVHDLGGTPFVCHFAHTARDSPATISGTKKMKKGKKGVTCIIKSFLSLRKKQQPIGADDAERVKGKIGQVTSYNKRTDCYTIKFEDENLEPVVVRRVDVRVVLDLDEYS